MGTADQGNVALGKGALPLKRLVSALYLAHAGRPIIVVGGGPSAPDQLHMLPFVQEAIAVSANGHATKLGLQPDYIFCKDDVHTETKQRMIDLLSPINAPIATCHWWGNYRTPRWPIQGNSGMMALALAALMGGQPIVPIGFDCYQNGTYFHDPKAKNVSLGRREGYWASRYQRLAARLKGACIRVFPGSLSAGFPQWTPGERIRSPVFVPLALQAYKTSKEKYVNVVKEFHPAYDRRTLVPAGTSMVMDEVEFVLYSRLGFVKEI